MTTDHERDIQAKLSQYKAELAQVKRDEAAFRARHADDTRAGFMGSRLSFTAHLEDFATERKRLSKLVRYYSQVG